MIMASNLSGIIQDNKLSPNIPHKFITSTLQERQEELMMLPPKVLRVWSLWSIRYLRWRVKVMCIRRTLAVNLTHHVLPWDSIARQLLVIIHLPSILQVFLYLLLHQQELLLRRLQVALALIPITILLCQVPQILPPLLLQMTVQIFRLRVLWPVLKHQLTSLSVP